MNHIGSRFACFACGVVINSFAIALITKGDMGTSQISSVPYVSRSRNVSVRLRWSPIAIADITAPE